MSLKFLTAGESHGPALSGIIEGLPAGIEVAPEDFSLLLKRRWAGYGRGKRQNIENDAVEVLAGIVNGKTIGSPVSLLIRNRDYAAHKSAMSPFGSDSSRNAINVPLPGHADFAGAIKHRFDDCRLVRERASARETAMRTALSLPVRNFLQALDIGFTCLVEAIGGVAANIDYQQDPNELAAAVAASTDQFLCPDPAACEKWRDLIDQAQKQGVSLGGTAAVIFWNLPIGLGSYCQAEQRLDARLAGRIMSIPAVKAVESGNALALSQQVGGAADALQYQSGRGFFHATNHAAGIEGGMTNGEPLIMRFHMKPLPGGTAAESVNLQTLVKQFPAAYRSDTQALQAAAIVAESVSAIELGSAILELTGGSDLETVIERLHKS